MWEDVWDEQFVDTMILISIPLISISLTAIVYLALYIYRRFKKADEKEDGDDVEEAVATEEEALAHANNQINQSKFGIHPKFVEPEYGPQ